MQACYPTAFEGLFALMEIRSRRSLESGDDGSGCAPAEWMGHSDALRIVGVVIQVLRMTWLRWRRGLIAWMGVWFWGLGEQTVSGTCGHLAMPRKLATCRNLPVVKERYRP